MSNEFTKPLNNAPPRTVGSDPDYAVQSAATAVTSTSTDLWASYPLDVGGLRTPQGSLWIELEATGFDVFLKFNRVTGGTVTAATGTVLRVGVPRIFYVNGSKDLFLDHISPGGVGTVKWRKVSPIGERNRT